MGLRVPVIIAVFVFGLVTLFGVNYVYQYSRVDQPLNRYFAGRHEVHDVQVSEQGQQVVIAVSLKKPVANLRETYLTLEKGAATILGSRPFRLEIKDNRDDKLVQDYYRLHYSLHEALSTGQFVAMARAVSDQAGVLGLNEAQVQVDERFLYIQLRRGNHFLYERLPRLNPAKVSGLDVKGGRGG